MLRHALAEVIGAIVIFAFFSGCSGVGSNRIVPEQSQGVGITPQSVTLSGHLYVADAAGVQRFPSPTLTYASVGSPIAVDGSNRLYARNGLTIDVYAAGATTLLRTLNIVVPRIYEETRLTGVNALALDSTGHLYVGVTIQYCIPASVGCVFFKRKGALIYAPNASGSPVPRVVLAPASCSGCSFFMDRGGLVLDSHGDLIVASDITNKVYAIASPLTAPMFATPIRTISGSGVKYPAGLAVDSSGVLYVDNPNGSQSFIAAFPVTANGSVAPTRKISVAGAVSFGNGIAVGGGHLYVPDVSGNSVDEVSSLVGGTQTPLRLAVASPEDVKLAP